MRMSEFIRHDQAFAHPDCAKCGAPMWLARIEPYEAGPRPAHPSNVTLAATPRLKSSNTDRLTDQL
jgi:hypothetical protein